VHSGAARSSLTAARVTSSSCLPCARQAGSSAESGTSKWRSMQAGAAGGPATATRRRSTTGPAGGSTAHSRAPTRSKGAGAGSPSGAPSAASSGASRAMACGRAALQRPFSLAYDQRRETTKGSE
jgi:hypothetical protein